MKAIYGSIFCWTTWLDIHGFNRGLINLLLCQLALKTGNMHFNSNYTELLAIISTYPP